MAQRYPPTKFNDPVFDAVDAPSLQADVMSANEYNTLLMAAEFDTADAIAVIEPWVLLKGSGSGEVNADLWSPLSEITMIASSVPPHPSLGPLLTNHVKAPTSQSEIPNCFEVRLLLKSISVGEVTVWAGLTNRAPR
jgi:hypothetical protein